MLEMDKANIPTDALKGTPPGSNLLTQHFILEKARLCTGKNKKPTEKLEHSSSLSLIFQYVVWSVYHMIFISDEEESLQ